MTRKYTKRNERRWGVGCNSHRLVAGYDAYLARRCAAKAAAAHKCIGVITNIISAFLWPYHLERKDYSLDSPTQCNGLAGRETSSGFSSNDTLESPGRVTPGFLQGLPGRPAAARRFFHAIPGTWVIVLPREGCM